MDLSLLGPLAPLAGTWEGNEGIDLAFSYGEGGAKETPFRERMTFEPFGPVVNGSQQLYGLDYRTTAWPIGEEEAFHMEVGYWLWDAAASQVMRCFMVPRGSTILAGGTAAADASVLEMQAEVGSETFGVLSNPHLAKAARCVRYDLKVRIEADDCFSYEEDTVLQLRPVDGLFHHTDRNRLRRA
ncbi:MAG: FABP family protein [bacterium]|nr:FABP family protein [bacterium]